MATLTCDNAAIKAKCLIQQCLNAKLQVKLKTNQQGEAEHVEIQRGVVLFVCILKGAEKSDIEKLVKTIVSVKLSETDDERHVSILDLPANVLVVPQATLGGRQKGKQFQYHNNIDKELGRELYSYFVDLMEKTCRENANWSSSGCCVHAGTYGIRQVYSTETNGPYLHFVEC